MRSQPRTKAEIYIEIICFDLAIRIASSMKKSNMLNNMNINMTFDQLRIISRDFCGQKFQQNTREIMLLLSQIKYQQENNLYTKN